MRQARDELMSYRYRMLRCIVQSAMTTRPSKLSPQPPRECIQVQIRRIFTAYAMLQPLNLADIPTVSEGFRGFLQTFTHWDPYIVASLYHQE